MALERVPRNTFREHIADRLRNSIIAGVLPPGSPITEMRLAAQFGVSRGPLREAIRQLIEEGLLVTVPYTGTRVIDISVSDVREIYSLRTVLETFAFRLAWPRRNAAFREEIDRRHNRLLASVETGDCLASTAAEMALHSLVYEWSGHKLLQEMWRNLAGRLHLYLAMHQRAHGRSGPLKDAHVRYVELAKGDDLGAMLGEIENHMRRGIGQLESFIREQIAVSTPGAGTAASSDGTR
jgi:DNA-binding GntR family transcriptional regulator